VPDTPTASAVFERWPRRQYALLNPGAAWPNKRWPADRFGALASAIARTFGWRSLVLWGPGEEALAAAVVAASGGAAEAAPPTSLTDMLALAQGARVMVAGDTGPLHIGGAVGTPLVSLFGPTRAERNGPWGLYDIAVSRTDRCQCLYKRSCSQATPCIDDISVDEVVSAVERRVAASG
jgi:ADP-heptose:LPS heptosyltransferase